jgi:hypothetical protein
LIRYEATAKNVSTDKLKNSIEKFYTQKSADSISVSIGDVEKMPFYWKFQEYGTDPFTFRQYYKIIFGNPGEPWRLKSVKKKTLPPFSFVIDSENVVVSDKKGKKYYKFIQVNHPGIRKRGFFLAGANFLESSGQWLTTEIMSELFRDLVNVHTASKK